MKRSNRRQLKCRGAGGVRNKYHRRISAADWRPNKICRNDVVRRNASRDGGEIRRPKNAKLAGCVARQIRGNSTSEPSRELLQAAESVRTDRLAVHFGIATTVSDFVCKASSKQALARAVGNEQVACVDMESAAVAHACSEHGIPFLIVRCISDRLDEDLPLDFNRCRKADGNISPAKVAWAALLHPQALGPLQELQKRSRACAEKLAQFVEELIPWIRL